MVKIEKKSPDYILIGISAILIILGILTLAGISASISQEKFDTPYYFLNRQILFGLLPGLILCFFVLKIRLELLKKWAPILFLFNLVLLAMIFLPKIGSEVGGAARWLNLGFISFQPSEFLKLTFILYLAIWLGNRTNKIIFSKSKKPISQTLLAFLAAIVIISLFLILQPDISTLGIIVFVAVSMYFLTNAPLWHMILLALITVGGLLTLIKLAPYRTARLLVFLKPEIDPMGLGYQIKQALIAIGSGGIFGLGLGMSEQKFGFLPQPLSDSIFAIFSEETGFVGSFILIFLFLLFFWRGVEIAKKTRDKFSQLTALGISLWITIQAFVNIGSMVGILPLTGIPLPFISYGGSHFIAELIGLGILLNISKTT